MNINLQMKVFLGFLLITITSLKAQESYEIQVYSSPTTEKNTTIFELHSNISPAGPKNATNFSNPLFETLEITTGITSNFELGFYLFSRLNEGNFNYIGNHIRPRITVPTSWNWYMGTSLSIEAGFVKNLSSNTYDTNYEIRPIFDKSYGNNYVSINPTIDGSLKTKEVSFSPNVKYSYTFSSKYALGIEYYGVTGNPFNMEKFDLQTHQFYLVTDIYFDPSHEFEFGIGRGTTQSSDIWNIKLIMGQRVNWKKKPKNPNATL